MVCLGQPGRRISRGRILERLMDTVLDVQKVQKQLDRAARDAKHGPADIRAGRFVHGNAMTDQTFTTISTLDDYPETARLLGTLTVAWSHAERILYIAFWVASETTQQKAFEVYENLPNFRARYELSITLLKQEQGNHPKFPKIDWRSSNADSVLPDSKRSYTSYMGENQRGWSCSTRPPTEQEDAEAAVDQG
jgi:hypothetical protein